MAHPEPRRLNVARPDAGRFAPNKFAIAERRRQAFRYKLAGLTTDAIALRLAADPAVNSADEAFPGGYGARNYALGLPPPSPEQLRREAAADVRVVVDRARTSIDRDNDVMFEVQLSQIDAAISAIWNPIGLKASQNHVARLTELLQLKAQMMGWLKSPVTVNIDQSVHVSAVSPQPEYENPQLAKFFEAMVEAGAEPPEVLEAARRSMAELLPVADPVSDAVPVDSAERDVE